MKRDGFTILEMLAVIAILGILLGIGIPSYLRWQQSQLLTQAQTLIATELSSARTKAKRANAAQEVTWTASTFNGKKLDRVTISTSPQTLTYQQPYGTLREDSAGNLPELTLTLNLGSRTAAVYVGGVFGKATRGPLN